MLEPLETVAVGGAVMPLAVSPDKRFLYAALRSQPYRVVSFAIDAASGHLRKLGESALADTMANIDVDRTGKWLFAASYNGHKITVNDIGKDGVVGAVQQVVATGPNAHAIHADVADRFVLATSLGADNVSIWRFDARLPAASPGDPPLVGAAAKSGPRHFVWDKAQRFVYLLGELDASVAVYAWDGARGALGELQRTTTLPTDATGKPWAADLHLSDDSLRQRAYVQHDLDVPRRPNHRPPAAPRPDADREGSARLRSRLERTVPHRRGTGIEQRLAPCDRHRDRPARSAQAPARGEEPELGGDRRPALRPARLPLQRQGLPPVGPRLALHHRRMRMARMFERVGDEGQHVVAFAAR